MKQFVSICLLLGLFASGAIALDYYVDPVAGSNANSGSQSAPFQTLSFAVSVAGDNDRIFLRPGTYDVNTGETFPIQIGPSFASDLALQIVGVDGAANTVIDATGAVIGFEGLLRFGPNATGARLSGVTIRNYPGTLATIRLGSSTASLATQGIEIEGCVIENSAAWGIATFGLSGSLGPLKLHDNLIVNCAADGFWISSIQGTGGGDVYNNTIVGCNNGIRVQGGTWNVVNNIVAGNTACGIFDFCDPTAIPCAADAGTLCPLTFMLTNDWNDVFGSAFNYFGITAGANSVSVDPAFVNPVGGDYHLQMTSLLVDAGSSVLPPFVETDVDGDPRVLDGNGNFIPVPDIGADEVAKYRYVLQAGAIAQGSTVTLGVTGPAGDLAILFFSAGTANLVVAQYGSLLIDITQLFSLFPVTAVGGTPATIGPIPVDPTLNGLFVYSQAVGLNLATGLGQLTNRIDSQL